MPKLYVGNLIPVQHLCGKTLTVRVFRILAHVLGVWWCGGHVILVDKTKAVLKEKHENISVIAFFLLSLHEIM